MLEGRRWWSSAGGRDSIEKVIEDLAEHPLVQQRLAADAPAVLGDQELV